LAAASGYKDAVQNRNKISAQMMPAQIAEAQKRSAEWLKMANATPMQATQGRVRLKMDGGTFVVPVQINGTMTLDFVIDSGAADVSVPADVVSTLIRAGSKSRILLGRIRTFWLMARQRNLQLSRSEH
jgi:predicted aspartyl protease